MIEPLKNLFWNRYAKPLEKEGKKLTTHNDYQKNESDAQRGRKNDLVELTEKKLALKQSNLANDDVVRSEVNFLVLPFFALWDKDAKKRIKTEYETKVKRGDQRLEVTWKVLAQPEFGYPNHFDKRVHKAVERIIEELPAPIQNPIPIGSFYNLCQKMGVTKGGKTYKSIRLALIKLRATTIQSKGAFYSKNDEKYIEDVFGVYDRVIFTGERLENGEIADDNYIYLNSWYLDNINANYVKPIDWDYYISLKTPLAQRLYELLGVKFYGVMMKKAKKLSYKYSTLCELLPAVRQKYLSKAKTVLDPAHEKLKETGFLGDYDWDETSPKTKGDWLITYTVGERAREEFRKSKLYFKSPQLEFETEALPEPEQDEQSEPLSKEQAELVEKLVKLNVSKNVADDLVGHFDNELIAKWTEAIHYADARDKAAYLVDAIRRDYALPEKWLNAKENNAREARIAEEKRIEEQKKEEELRKKREESKRLGGIYNSLSDEQKEEVDKETESRISYITREWIREGRTDSGLVQEDLKTNREQIIKEWLESGKIKP